MADSEHDKNLYYPVFRSIEHEVIELSSIIYFSDQQLNVFSIKISELLSRTSTEIESLFKDLYRREFGTEPKTVGKAFTELDSKWGITKKELSITSDNFYFTKSFTPSFAPMGYKSKSKDDYHSAYNSIKHDRAKNLYKANLNVLIRALGALYILNVYYTESALRSEVFTAKTAGQSIGIFMGLGMGLKKFIDSCLFIEYHEFAYYLWLENNYDSMRALYSGLGKDDKRTLKNKVERQSSNLIGNINGLIYRSNKNGGIGQILTQAHTVVKDLIESEISVVVNVGYNKVYTTPDQMIKPVSKIKDSDKIVSMNQLKRPLGDINL